MSGGPEPHLDLDEVRRQARALAEGRRTARRDYERYTKQEAEAEHDYRKKKAQAYLGSRSEGTASNGAEIVANAAAAEERMRRDIAHSMAKAAEQRIAELEADRAMLRQLAEWSRALEGLPQPDWNKQG